MGMVVTWRLSHYSNNTQLVKYPYIFTKNSIVIHGMARGDRLDTLTRLAGTSCTLKTKKGDNSS